MFVPLNWNSGVDLTVVSCVVLGLIGLKALHQFILYPWALSPLRALPGPKGSLWSLKYILYGEFPKIMYSEAGVLQREWSKLYGKVIRAVGPFGIERVIFLSPAAMQKVLVDDWIDYPRADFIRHTLGLIAGYGLLTHTGDEHRTMRRTLNPAFSIASLSAQTDMYYEPIYSLVSILKSKCKAAEKAGTGNRAIVVPVYDWLSKVTLDIICLTAFGYVSDSLHSPHNELAEAYHDLLSLQNGKNSAAIITLVSIPGIPKLLRTKLLYNHRWILKYLPQLAPMEILVDSIKRIRDISAQILAERTKDALAVGAADSSLAGKKDIMSLLVQSRMQDTTSGDGASSKMIMSDEMMMEQVLTFLGAGHETTASGLAWTFWLLSTHPKIQEKLRAEVAPVLAHNPNPDFRTLKGMDYLNYVVMESLRLFPPAPMTVRKSAKGDFVDGVWVPKGTLFYIAIRVINTYKGFWGNDAEEFRPERWAELDKAPDYHPTHSFQTFINGPHHCIGKTMAIVEMSAVLAIIIASFKFSPAYPGQKAHPTAAITMKPADNLPLLIEPVED
ncbi:cytochrome P450 [Irpex rosettiformis]|uniref:Cytochrome P450 n=1 Tax=Irpex rosettiformis TaxID=378272 RepID=A0ACB8UHK5_9APHY|nr:cytochrome P450 [Irpex rosettiformis]